MRESGAPLLSQTADEALDLIVAIIPKDVMQTFEVERESLIASNNHVQNPYASVASREGLYHRICPYKQIHQLAVIGLLLDGMFVAYLSALHMGYLSSEESTMFSFTDIPPSLTSANVTPTAFLNNSGSNTSSVESPSAHLNASTDDFFRVDDNVTFHDPIPAPSLGSEKSPGFMETPTSMIYFQNRSETWHTMSDKDLLKKASSFQPLQASVTLIAYMFMTRGPLPFASLWERYFRGHENMYSIYIHAHPDYVPTTATGSPFFQRFIPSKVQNPLTFRCFGHVRITEQIHV